MYRFKPAPTRASHRIDLETVRETILYMRDDLSAEPDLCEVTQALDQAVLALDAAALGGKKSKAPRAPNVARFFANR